MTTEIEPVKLFQNVEHDSWNSAADYASKEIFVLSTSFTSSIPKIRDWFDEMVQDFFNKQGRTATSEWMILGAKALAIGSTDLEAVFKQIAFDKVFDKAAVTSKVKSEEEARLQAKRDAAIVSGATSGKQTTAPVSAAPKSVFEAFEQAKRTLNL